MRRRLACLLAVLALLAAPACSDDDENDSGNADETPGTTAQASDAVRVTMKDFSFDPKPVEVPASGGTLRLVNEGSADHTFTVDSLNIDRVVTAGSEMEVPVGAVQGEVPYYCRFHKAQGMEGTLRATG